MEWVVQNAFELVALAASTAGAVWGASKAYYNLNNRISNVEADMLRLDKKLDEDLDQLRMIVVELKSDIKKLTEILLTK